MVPILHVIVVMLMMMISFSIVVLSISHTFIFLCNCFNEISTYLSWNFFMFFYKKKKMVKDSFIESMEPPKTGLFENDEENVSDNNQSVITGKKKN